MTLQYLNEGDITHIQGSGKKPYEVKMVGGVVSCSCPAWRNMGGGIDTRVCKHIKANIDPKCLLPQASATLNGSVTVSAPTGVLPTVGIVGIPMTAALNIASQIKHNVPGCLRAHTRTENDDPTGWHLSEKLDGVRAWWNGERFLSREGKEFFAPEEFKAKLPKNLVLDGELWMGRKMFQKTVSVVRKVVPNSVEWENISYVIYDAPEVPGPFETRMKAATALFPSRISPETTVGLGNVWCLEQNVCTGVAHMTNYLEYILSIGGEGAMIRQPGSLYESGKSHTCLKIKKFLDDEAIVLGYTKGKGKHTGRVGALEVSWNGKEFEIGTGLSDEERKNPPAIGSRITFKYTETTDGGIPKFASFIAVRDYE